MARILLNFDVASLYPSEIEIFGYSSRNQESEDAYVNLKKLRIQAKHGQVDENFLKSLNLTNKDLSMGLKLPLNAYTGALRAVFNQLYDNLQGFSICMTGQLLILQLIHDLQKIPTLEMVEANTDAVQFFIDDSHKEDALKVLDDWQKLTGLELEEDNVVKMIARDVNNYVEIVNPEDNYYEVHYKGGLFTGNHDFKWNKEKKVFEYSFKDDLKSNSLTICAEAILKELLFNIPCEDTINNCNDIFRFQMISHLGGTYDKCVINYPGKEEIELQRNNRIYAGKEKNGAKIYKVKSDGRHDSLANCPPNPIVDNANELTIDKINKSWYIKYTKQKISDFIGRKEVYMDEKYDKLKKDELIEMIKNMKEKEENNMISENNEPFDSFTREQVGLLHKIQEFRKMVRERNFILDSDLPNNLGSGEYFSIDQVYQAVQDIAIQVGLDFSFEVVGVDDFYLGAFKPATGAPQNVATVRCIAQFTDIDSGACKSYTIVSQGSDSIDKAVNSASTYAFRNWFNKNFTPKKINGEYVKFGDSDNNFSVENTPEEPKSKTKTPVFVPKEKKEQIVKETTEELQKPSEDKSDVDKLTELIYEYRELSGKETAGKNKLDKVIAGDYTDMDVLTWTLSFENAIADLKKGK